MLLTVKPAICKLRRVYKPYWKSLPLQRWMNHTKTCCLPSLHYFVRTQDGLHICLHKQCPGRRGGKPAFFVSRKITSKHLRVTVDCYLAGRSLNLLRSLPVANTVISWCITRFGPPCSKSRKWEQLFWASF